MICLPGMAQIWAAVPEARVVGGAVRDMLVGRDVADVDFAAPLSPDELMVRAKKAGLKFIPTGLAHGTITLLAAGRAFEVTSLRRDVETDGRHARVAFTDDWQEDAARRDFTVNAMSCGQDGKVFDYFGGQSDLEAGIIRFVGDARQRIVEDYLRILRFFRFFARYGQGKPNADAVAGITAERGGIANLSAERVWSEIKKIVQAPAPLPAVMLMQQTGVLEIILPGAYPERLAALLARGAPADPLLRLAALTNEDLASRLRLSSAEAQSLTEWRRPFALVPKDTDSQVRRALANTKPDVLLAQSWLYGGDDASWASLRARLSKVQVPIFPVLGRDLLALGLQPGAQMGECLAALRQWWWEGGCVAQKPECLARLVDSSLLKKREEC